MTDLEPHVLRFWESEFKELAPKKSDTGRRVYSDHDVEIIYRIKRLLYDKKYTIEGAKNVLKDRSFKQSELEFESNNADKMVKMVKSELLDILKLLR